MGTLTYGVAPAITIDDWGLRHLQAVVTTKLRRDEGFVFSWDDEPGVDGAAGPSHHECFHGSIWVAKSSALYFSYDGPVAQHLNMGWLQILADAAASTHGLRLLPEPAAAEGR